MRKLRILVLLGAVLLEAGCGLPDSYFLVPPNVVTQATQLSTTFSFSNPNHANDINVYFKGFDLYYKFYPDTVSPTGNDYDSTNPADVVTQLLSKGFLPVCTASDFPSNRAIPTIPISAADAAQTGFTITITPNPPGGTPPTALLSTYSYTGVSSGFVSVEIRRNVPDYVSANGYKTFSSIVYNPDLTNNYPPAGGDPEFTSALYSAASIHNGFTYLGMYAISYGLTGSSTPSRSTPVWLGFLQLQILQ